MNESNRRHWLQAMLAGALGPRLVRAEPVLTVGVVPQQTASELAEKWTPVLQWLSEHSGLRLQFATAPDIPTFEKRLAAAEYDLAYMNPYHFTVFNARPGYAALARAKDERIHGVLVVRQDSLLKDLRELAGATLAFPAPASFGASVLIQAQLRRQGIAFVPQIVKSHNSVYLNVAKGYHVAGGGVQRTLDLLEPELRGQLRVLWRTPDFTSHAIASRPGLNPAFTHRLWQAMEAMPQEPAGLQRLARIGFKGFERARDKDWDDVRQLRIRPADTQIQGTS